MLTRSEDLKQVNALNPFSHQSKFNFILDLLHTSALRALVIHVILLADTVNDKRKKDYDSIYE